MRPFPAKRVRPWGARMTVVAFASALALGGCGGASSSTSSPTATSTSSSAAPSSMSKAQAAATYLSIATGVQGPTNQLKAAINTWNDSTTGDEIAAQAKPYTDALTAATYKLASLANSYPPAATDLKALIQAYAPQIADLEGAGAVTAGTASTWAQQLVTDVNKTHAAVETVRADLGLPPT